MLNEMNQSQKDKFCIIPPTWGTQSTLLHGDRKRNCGCQGLGEGRQGSHCSTVRVSGMEFQFCKMKTVLEMDGGDGSTTMWMYSMPLSCMLKNGKFHVICILTQFIQSILKKISPENSLEGLMLKLKLIFWPPDAKNWLIWKDPDAGKDWRWEEKGMTEDEMIGWHHQLNRL